ncbi:sensor domain-containing diguanylate cyclase [Paractinoplanes maris]|uniref:sensor domain-containing diguanylate cyclase n=1 Tax=Paractinoplanes maris TaxID=1734446 RepID=UPI00202292A9|nr:sensor domain-containing diguanylate cyclase [Actinoplanes maris]
MATGLRRWLAVALVLAVLIGGGAATWLGMLEVRQVQHRQAALLMDHNAEAIQRAVANEASRYTETLADITAAVGSQTDFSAADFEAVTSRLTRDRLPGASTVAYLVPAQDDEIAEVQSHWRARGAADLTLKSAGDALEHQFLIFSRSLDHVTLAPGIDLTQAEEPAAALRFARASGEVTASHPYVLLKDRARPTVHKQQSFLLAAPVTGAAGTPAAGQFQGWVTLSMRGSDFVEETLHAYAGDLLKVTLSDQDASVVTTVASTSATARLLPDTSLRRVRSVYVGEREWQIDIEPTQRLISETDRRLPFFTLLIGLLVTVLAGFLADSRRRALKRVADATALLRHDIERRKAVEARLLDREDELRHLAMHDALTKLPNRALFHERLEQSLDQPLAVFFIDLDGFKAVNDGLGHSAGDQLLIDAAARLLQCARAGDTVARLGGDEFAILASAPSSFSEAFAERIVSSLRAPFDVDGQPVTISCSVGVAVSAGGPADARRLVHTADEAMYAAKAAGKNRYMLADAEPAATRTP